MTPCDKEELFRDLSNGNVRVEGKIDTLIAEFKAMNGALKDTKVDFNEHKKVAWGYRKKIDILWAVIHAVKWTVMFLFGTGVLFKVMEKMMK